MRDALSPPASRRGDANTVGKDHFVYYDRKDPRRCLAPDAFVKLGVQNHLVDSWKTWELGVPELCIEVLSPSDTEEKLTFREKLRRYGPLKTRELVVFHADGKPGKRLRAWDRRGSMLVERVVTEERTPCRTLGLQLAVVPHDELGAARRLVDASGNLVLTRTRPGRRPTTARHRTRGSHRDRSAARSRRGRGRRAPPSLHKR